MAEGKESSPEQEALIAERAEVLKELERAETGAYFGANGPGSHEMDDGAAAEAYGKEMRKDAALPRLRALNEQLGLDINSREEL